MKRVPRSDRVVAETYLYCNLMRVNDWEKVNGGEGVGGGPRGVSISVACTCCSGSVCYTNSERRAVQKERLVRNLVSSARAIEKQYTALPILCFKYWFRYERKLQR